jgi:hypothetical protein
MALQHLRSNTASKRPTPASMADGQLAINTNATSAGLFFKDAGGALIKVGPVHVGTSAPNSSPAGSSGNAIGEQWLDTSGGGYVLKIWDGSAWRNEMVTSAMIADGTIVNADINASAEIAVSKLADGAARQLLQTDAAGTGVEWTDDVDVPGTLDVTGATTLDAAVTIASLNAVATTKAQHEESEIKRNAAFSVGVAGAIPFGVGPVIPPGMAFFGIGPDAYNSVHLVSGSFC